MVLAHDTSTGERTLDVKISHNVTFDTLLLSKSTLDGLKNAGFRRPSPIQLHGIPLGKCGFDLLLEAKSGTGKTAVFAVIALEKLDLSKGLQTIVLAPTREIAAQVCDVIKEIGSQYKNLSVEVVMGGLSIKEDIEKFRKGRNVHILVGSPGRLKHLIQDKYINTSSVRLLVLDEADKLMEKSFQADINYIFSTLPHQKQVIMSSATYAGNCKEFISKYVDNAQHIRPDTTSILLGIEQKVTTVISHVNIVRQTQLRYEELIKIMTKKQFKQCLIFCNYQARVTELHHMLTRDKWPSEQLHGQQEQTDRLDALKTLQNFKCRILISTDLAARGIDASNVDLVINFEPPYEWPTYLHRIGRAGRYGSFGMAITILSLGKEEKKFKDMLSAMKDTLNISDLWKNNKIMFEDPSALVLPTEKPLVLEPSTVVSQNKFSEVHCTDDHHLENASGSEVQRTDENDLEKADSEVPCTDKNDLEKASDSEVHCTDDHHLENASGSEVQRTDENDLEKASDSEVPCIDKNDLEKVSDSEVHCTDDHHLEKASGSEVNCIDDNHLEKISGSEILCTNDHDLEKGSEILWNELNGLSGHKVDNMEFDELNDSYINSTEHIDSFSNLLDSFQNNSSCSVHSEYSTIWLNDANTYSFLKQDNQSQVEICSFKDTNQNEAYEIYRVSTNSQITTKREDECCDIANMNGQINNKSQNKDTDQLYQFNNDSCITEEFNNNIEVINDLSEIKRLRLPTSFRSKKDENMNIYSQEKNYYDTNAKVDGNDNINKTVSKVKASNKPTISEKHDKSEEPFLPADVDISEMVRLGLPTSFGKKDKKNYSQDYFYYKEPKINSTNTKVSINNHNNKIQSKVVNKTSTKNPTNTENSCVNTENLSKINSMKKPEIRQYVNTTEDNKIYENNLQNFKSTEKNRNKHSYDKSKKHKLKYSMKQEVINTDESTSDSDDSDSAKLNQKYLTWYRQLKLRTQQMQMIFYFEEISKLQDF